MSWLHILGFFLHFYMVCSVTFKSTACELEGSLKGVQWVLSMTRDHFSHSNRGYDYLSNVLLCHRTKSSRTGVYGQPVHLESLASKKLGITAILQHEIFHSQVRQFLSDTVYVGYILTQFCGRSPRLWKQSSCSSGPLCWCASSPKPPSGTRW